MAVVARGLNTINVVKSVYSAANPKDAVWLRGATETGRKALVRIRSIRLQHLERIALYVCSQSLVDNSTGLETPLAI